MTNQEFDEQLEEEGLDWGYIVMCVALIVILVLAAVGGHYQVSLGVQP